MKQLTQNKDVVKWVIGVVFAAGMVWGMFFEMVPKVNKIYDFVIIHEVKIEQAEKERMECKKQIEKIKNELDKNKLTLKYEVKNGKRY